MAGLIPQTFIQDLLTRVDIVELINLRVPLKKAGTNFHACCPFHTEKTPSFTVSPAKQFYHCFGCGVSGNAIGFLINYERLDFVAAVESLAQHAGVDVPREEDTPASSAQKEKLMDLYSTLEQSAQFYQQQLRAHPKAIDYLKSRELSGAIAKQYALGFAPAGWDHLIKHIHHHDMLLNAGLVIKKEKEQGFYDRFRDRVMFPIRDRRGRVVGFGGRVLDDSLPKYLNSPETSIFHKSQVLYGLYEARSALREFKQMLVVEGYMDVIALAQADIRYAVATLGTAVTAQHVQQLFQNTDKVIFCFDGDNAGRAAAWRALEATLSVIQDGWQVRFLFLPDGEDPDSLVRKIGKAEFEKRLDDQAKSLPDFLFSTLQQRINNNSMEGRARLAQMASPLIDKIEAPVLRELMSDRLSELVRLDKSRISTLTSKKKDNAAQTKTRSKKHLTPMRLAIVLLLQNPALHVEKASVTIEQLTLSGAELLKQLFSVIKQHPQLNTGALLECWRDQPEAVSLHKLAGMEHFVPEEGIQAEWQDVLQQLFKLQREEEIEHLLTRMNELSAVEKKHLQALLVERGK